MPETDLLLSQIDRLVNIVRSIQLKRVLHTVEEDSHLNFWRFIKGNLFDVAVIEWCKIFGTDNERTHWKNVVTCPDEFRKKLFEHMGVDEPTWNAYWKEMKKYRNTHISHNDKPDSSSEKYPQLDLALKSSYFYYAFLVDELKKREVFGSKQKFKFPDSLEEYSKKFVEQSIKVAKKAMDATKVIKESVY